MLPRQQVWDLFDNFDNMKKWQQGFQSYEPISGEPGSVGAKTKLVYVENGKTFELVETMLERVHGERMKGTYEADNVYNTIQVLFTDNGDGTTTYTMKSEFEFTGYMKFMAPFMKGMFKKRTRSDLERFKRFAESAAN